MSEQEQRPQGELGAAFADLVRDAPASELAAWDIIGEVRRRGTRRRNILVGVAAAVVGVSVVTAVIVNGVNGSSSTSAATAVTSSAVASALTSSAAAAPQIRSQPEQAAGGAADSASSAPGSSGSSPAVGSSASGGASSPAKTGSAAPGEQPASATQDASTTAEGAATGESDGCPVALTAAQAGLVQGLLPDLQPPISTDSNCTNPAITASSDFQIGTAPGAAFLGVRIYAGDPGLCAAGECTAVDGRPGVQVVDFPDGGRAVQVVAGNAGVVVSAQPSVDADGVQTQPFTPDQLAQVAQAIAGTLS